MKSVYVKTLGCKVNTFDSHAIENQFRRRGFVVVDHPKDATVTVINSCSVTANAEKEARYLLRHYRREHPSTSLIVTGCYAQTNSARLAEMPEVDLVVPNEIKDNLVTAVENLLFQSPDPHGAVGPKTAQEKIPNGVTAVLDNRQSHFKSSITLFDHSESSRTRAFVKIQDGCNGFCAYCLIPYARGGSRSVPREQVLAEVRRLLELGVPEIVLTGIHVGDYGEDLPEYKGIHQPFVSLVQELMGIEKMGRLRISSLEPNEATDELLAVLATHGGKFCDHFHLPLQAGSNNVLKRMRRTYTTGEYQERVLRIRSLFPMASIGADVIPGFPGESDEEFQETLHFIAACKLSYLHVFPYSTRPNTSAARMPDHVDPRVIKERAGILRDLSKSLSEAFGRQFFGSEARVLWEKDTDVQGRRIGTARNYLKVVGLRHPMPEAGVESVVMLKGFVEAGRLLGVMV